jgi:hypothetical protein
MAGTRQMKGRTPGFCRVPGLTSCRALSFVLLFLLAQAGAMVHGFGHLDEDEGEAAMDVCVFCLAAAALDTAASPPDAPDLILPPPVIAVFLPLCVSGFSSPCRVYWERAPPARILYKGSVKK